MEPLSLKRMVDLLGGDWVSTLPLPKTLVEAVSTDSRSLSHGALFVALHGETFDGHAFVEEARRKGALANVVSRDRLRDLPPGGAPYVAVDDPLSAMERLAAWNRQRLALTVIGVTGSVGKTSTKEFLAAILSMSFRVKSSPKSFNNRIGVANTLLSADPATDVLVAELGTSGRGELSHLSRIVRPHKVVLTEIAPAHLAGLGSLDGIVEAKAEIFEGLEPGGAAFLRHGVYGFDRFAARRKGPLATFGWNEGDYAVTRSVPLRDRGVGRGFEFTVNDAESFLLQVPGHHNILNATAALAVARDMGMSWEDIRAGLARARLPPLRLQVHEEGGVVFVDDSYNANPASMAAAIEEWLAMRNGGGPGATGGQGETSALVAVLGDMLEMGSESRRFHEDIGRKLSKAGARLVVTVGSDSRWIGEACRDGGGASETVHFENVAGAIPFLKDRLRAGDQVLFKASRRVGLDEAVSELRKWLGGPRQN